MSDRSRAANRLAQAERRQREADGKVLLKDVAVDDVLITAWLIDCGLIIPRTDRDPTPSELGKAVARAVTLLALSRMTPEEIGLWFTEQTDLRT
jgi:hypothetical protein